MDAHKLMVSAARLEVVETGRRRRWSEEQKLRIVLESLAGPRLASATARRHGISRSLLTRWRREFRPTQEGVQEIRRVATRLALNRIEPARVSTPV